MSVATGAPDSAALADRAAGWSAAYVHVPFCSRLCPYCDFAVVTGRDAQAVRYVDAVCREVGMEPAWRPLDAIYLGGGTPSRLAVEQLRRVIGTLLDRFGLNSTCEISLEANPEDWSPELASGLIEAGFTRVSFGVQSFDREVLASLGRQHSPQQAVQAVRHAREAGFRSVNIDLIFGTPGEKIDSWAASLDRALALEPDHLAVYALTVERGTALSRAIARGAPGPDPDLQADDYEIAQRRCADAGLVRYEVSNWARPDHACVYNLVTWAQGEYLAFGTGAHGHRAGARRRNIRRLDAYLERVERGLRPEQGREELDGWGREQERLLLGLRRAAGAVSGEGGAALLAGEWGRRLREAGVIDLEGDRLAVKKPLLTDEVSRAVLALQPGEC